MFVRVGLFVAACLAWIACVLVCDQVPSLLDMKALRNLFEVVPRLR